MFQNSKSLLETYVDKMYILFFVSQGIGLCNSTTAYVREINKNVCCLFLINVKVVMFLCVISNSVVTRAHIYSLPLGGSTCKGDYGVTSFRL